MIYKPMDEIIQSIVPKAEEIKKYSVNFNTKGNLNSSLGKAIRPWSIPTWGSFSSLVPVSTNRYMFGGARF